MYSYNKVCLPVRIVIISIILTSCSTVSLRDIPADAEDFKKTFHELKDKYPEINNYQRKRIFGWNLAKPEDLESKWGLPDEINKATSDQFLWTSISIGASIALLGSMGVSGIVPAMLFLASGPIPVEECIWEKGNYKITTYNVRRLSSGFGKRIQYWKWEDLRDNHQNYEQNIIELTDRNEYCKNKICLVGEDGKATALIYYFVKIGVSATYNIGELKNIRTDLNNTTPSSQSDISGAFGLYLPTIKKGILDDNTLIGIRLTAFFDDYGTEQIAHHLLAMSTIHFLSDPFNTGLFVTADVGFAYLKYNESQTDNPILDEYGVGMNIGIGLNLPHAIKGSRGMLSLDNTTNFYTHGIANNSSIGIVIMF